MENEINNIIETQQSHQIIKPKLRWVTGIILLFLSFYYFYQGSLRTLFDLQGVFFLTVFTIMPAAIVCLVFIYSAYRAEASALSGKLTWKRIITYNILLALILYISAYLFSFTFLIGLFLFAEPGVGNSVLSGIIYFIGLVIIIFSIIPTIILKIYHHDKKKNDQILYVFLAIIFLLSFGYKWASSKTCNFGRNQECLEHKAVESNDFNFCKKIKQQDGRNECYYGTAYENNFLGACEEIDSKYNVGLPYSRDDCYYNVFLKWDLKDKTFCYKISDQELKNSCLTEVAGNTGDEQLCQSEELNDNDKQRCRDKIAKSSAFLKKDHSLCENIKSSGIGASMKDYCYWDLVIEAGIKEAGLCQKIENNSLNFRCFSNVAKSLKQIGVCDSISSPHYQDECKRKYSEE